MLVAHLAALQRHGEWADRRLLEALRSVVSPEALRECAHVRGAQETWLARIEGRPATLPVWPELTVEELAHQGAGIDAGWRRFLADLDASRLGTAIAYRNSAGDSFATPLGEILLHVMLHGQYHRGKANAALRAAGTPVGLDYILWQRSRD